MNYGISYFKDETPRRTFSTFQSETSDYRINASQIIKENSSIRNYYKEKSRNIKKYLRNFHLNSYSEKSRLNSTKTIRNNDIKNKSFNYNQCFNKTLTNFNYKNSLSTIHNKTLNNPNSIILKNENNTITNNYKTISYSNNIINDFYIPPIIKYSGEKKLFKDKYGRLQQFEDKIKELRHHKYIKYILGNQYYFKQAEGSVGHQLNDITVFGKNITQKLFNNYLSTFKQYSLLLNRTLDRENDFNENEMLIENRLRNEIVRLKTKKEKLLRKITDLMEMKKFLLCVKNKSLDIEKFNNEDKKQILDDIERRNLIINDYDKTKRKNSVVKVKIKESKLMKSKNSVVKFHSDNNINNKFGRRKSTKIIMKTEEYFPPNNKIIFYNVEDFDNIYLILSEENKTMLKDYNKKLIDIEKLKSKLNMIIEENNISFEKKNNEINKELNIKIEKRQIVKSKYENLLINKKNILDSEKQGKLFDIYKEKIESIFKYINLNYLKYKERVIYNIDEIKNPIIEKLYFIEKVYIELTQKINKLIKEEPEKYKEIIKIIMNRTKQELFLKNKKEQKENSKKKLEKTQKRINKIYFIPFKKVQEKYPIQNRKKELNQKKLNYTSEQIEYDFFQM